MGRERTEEKTREQGNIATSVITRIWKQREIVVLMK